MVSQLKNSLCRTPAQRKEIHKLLVNNEKLVDKLVQICYNSIEESDTLKGVDYSQPGWSAQIAEKVGRRKAFQELLDLLSLTEDTPTRGNS
jgi:hypothetical protein